VQEGFMQDTGLLRVLHTGDADHARWLSITTPTRRRRDPGAICGQICRLHTLREHRPSVRWPPTTPPSTETTRLMYTNDGIDHNVHQRPGIGAPCEPTTKKHRTAERAGNPIGFGRMLRKEDARFIRGKATTSTTSKCRHVQKRRHPPHPLAHARIVSIDTRRPSPPQGQGGDHRASSRR